MECEKYGRNIIINYLRIYNIYDTIFMAKVLTCLVKFEINIIGLHQYSPEWTEYILVGMFVSFIVLQLCCRSSPRIY